MPFEEPCIYLTKESNELNRIWWRYAEETPVYGQIHKEMCVKKEWFFGYGIGTLNAITAYVSREKYLYRRSGYVIERRKNIERLMNSNEKNFLAALYLYYGMNIEYEKISDKKYESNADELFDILNNDRYVIGISVFGNVSVLWDIFIDKFCVQVRDKFKRGESYAAIIDMANKVVVEKVGEGLQRVNYRIDNNQALTVQPVSKDKWMICMNNENSVYYLSVSSLAYDVKNNIVENTMLINNIDYSINMPGINLVVYDRIERMVVDSFNLNIGNNKEIQITR